MQTRWLAAALFAACGATTPKVTKHEAPVAVRTEAHPELEPMPLRAEIHKGTLPNGLTYYVLPHGKPQKRAALWLAVNAGSVQEDEDQRGLAHFDEHMAFNGTAHFPKSQIVDYLEKIGMRFGADLNAYTTHDQTVFQLEVPTDDPVFLGRGLDILREWAGNVSYDPVEVDKERGVVREEWRSGRGAGRRLRDKQEQVLFAGTRYADRDTIGRMGVIDHASRDTLLRFYEDWYRPENMAVIAVGDFDPAVVQAELTKRFGDLPRGTTPRVRPLGGVPQGAGTRVSIEADAELPGTGVTVSNLVAHRPLRSRTDFRRHLVEQLYVTILNDRLRTIARRADAPFIAAAGQIETEVREVDAFERHAVAKSGKADIALRALLTEVLRIERHGVTPGELERVRANAVRAFSQSAETEATEPSHRLAEEITRNFFASELIIGTAAEKALALPILASVGVDELNAQIRALSGEDDRVVLIAGPEKKALPNEAQVRAILAEVGKLEIGPWHEEAAASALMPTPPTPGKIVAEKKLDAISLTEWTLSNGARVIVKPTDYEVDGVAFSSYSPGGTAVVPEADYPTARFARDVVELGGVADLDAEALNRALTGKRSRVAVSIAEVSESVSGSSSAHDLETLLQLVHLRMTSPRKDAALFSVWQQNAKEQLANLQRLPEVRFALQAQDVVWKGNARRRPPVPADIDKVDLDKALAIYRDRFGDASDFTFVLVGAVKLDELRPLVEKYLASLPAHGRNEKERDLKLRRVGGAVARQWKFGHEPKAVVSIELHGEEPWTRDKDRDVTVLGSVLSIKLRESLREDLGGVYGVNAGGGFTRSPFNEHTFDIGFTCDPKRVDELKKSVFETIAKIASDGVPEEVLEKVRSTYRRERELALRQNGFWAGWLVNAFRYGDDPMLVTNTAPMIARMTSANVKAAAKHYLDRKQSIELVLEPEDAPAGGATP